MTRSLYALKIGLLVGFLILLIACKKEPGTGINNSQAPQTNKPPTADAGPDQVLTLPTDSIELIGKGTDTDGTIARYNWLIEGYQSQRGKYVTFAFQTPIVKLKNLQEGMYWCKLTVTDNGGLSHAAESILRVVSAGCPCYPDPCDAFGDPCNPWDY